MRSQLASALCLAAGLLCCAAPAPAQTNDPDRVASQGDAKAREACTPDVMRLCNAYIPDIPQIVACLKRERANLSPACGEIFAAEAPPEPAKKVAKTTSSKRKSDKRVEKKSETKVAQKKKKREKVGAPLNLSATAKATR
jgi:hypothetical protein